MMLINFQSNCCSNLKIEIFRLSALHDSLSSIVMFSIRLISLESIIKNRPFPMSMFSLYLTLKGKFVFQSHNCFKSDKC